MSTWQERFLMMDRLLAGEYGEPEYAGGEPLDELVAAILSQNTSDVNSGRAYRSLRAAFPTWALVMDAPHEAVEEAIRTGGLAKTKCVRIQKLLRAVAGSGALNLDYLHALSDEEAERVLRGFDGIGPKTARCVLLFAMGRDVFPVDTHIHRVLTRVGILHAGMTAEKAHAWLGPRIPKGRCLALHINLIRHGRYVCHPRHPGCGRCVLRKGCAMGKKARVRGDGE